MIPLKYDEFQTMEHNHSCVKKLMSCLDVDLKDKEYRSAFGMEPSRDGADRSVAM
jgi:hypothetical protein